MMLFLLFCGLLYITSPNSSFTLKLTISLQNRLLLYLLHFQSIVFHFFFHFPTNTPHYETITKPNLFYLLFIDSPPISHIAIPFPLFFFTFALPKTTRFPLMFKFCNWISRSTGRCSEKLTKANPRVRPSVCLMMLTRLTSPKGANAI